MSRDEKRGMAFVGPAVIVMALLVMYPIVSVFYLSFMQVDEDGQMQWAGLSNFVRIIDSSDFPMVMRNTLVWTVLTVCLSFVLGLSAALLVNQTFIRAKGFWRSCMLLPWIVPGVVTATTWKWLYSSDFGMWNHMLLNVGLIRQPVGWLSDPRWVFASLILIQVWGAFPFIMLMITAGLQSIPSELYEAASLDGANWWAELVYVTLPSLRAVIFIALLVEIVWALNAFTLIWVTTQGGPAGRSRILSLSIYDAFRSFDLNGAASVALIQLVVSLVFALAYVYRSSKEE